MEPVPFTNLQDPSALVVVAQQRRRPRREISPAPTRASPVRERRPLRSNPRSASPATSPARERRREAQPIVRQQPAAARLLLPLRTITRTKAGRAILLSLVAWAWMAMGVAALVVGEQHATLASAALFGVVSVLL